MPYCGPKLGNSAALYKLCETGKLFEREVENNSPRWIVYRLLQRGLRLLPILQSQEVALQANFPQSEPYSGPLIVGRTKYQPKECISSADRCDFGENRE